MNPVEPTDILYQCIPNFSEGRRAEVVTAIAEAIATTPGVSLLDYSADADHNRCVMTFLGTSEAIRSAVLAATRIAVARIDMRKHSGVHPRVGALDVLPIVPLGVLRPPDTQLASDSSGISLPALIPYASALAHTLGNDLANALKLPVYFYDWAAQKERKSALPELRKGGFEAFAALPLVGDRAPDVGPSSVHPTAGIAIVGARSPLVAYNINLDSPNLAVARAIARRIREERDRLPELAGVRTLGLYLVSRNRAQVSMNLTRPDQTTLPAIFAFVKEEAARQGISLFESEIIGCIPLASLGGLSPDAILWRDYKPSQILENGLLSYPLVRVREN